MPGAPGGLDFTKGFFSGLHTPLDVCKSVTLTDENPTCEGHYVLKDKDRGPVACRSKKSLGEKLNIKDSCYQNGECTESRDQTLSRHLMSGCFLVADKLKVMDARSCAHRVDVCSRRGWLLRAGGACAQPQDSPFLVWDEPCWETEHDKELPATWQACFLQRTQLSIKADFWEKKDNHQAWVAAEAKLEQVDTMIREAITDVHTHSLDAFVEVVATFRGKAPAAISIIPQFFNCVCSRSSRRWPCAWDRCNSLSSRLTHSQHDVTCNPQECTDFERRTAAELGWAANHNAKEGESNDDKQVSDESSRMSTSSDRSTLTSRDGTFTSPYAIQ